MKSDTVLWRNLQKPCIVILKANHSTHPYIYIYIKLFYPQGLGMQFSGTAFASHVQGPVFPNKTHTHTQMHKLKTKLFMARGVVQ